MSFSNDEITFFKLALLDDLLTRADIVIRPRIPSSTLRQAMRKTFDVKGRKFSKGSLFIPHYWAVMVHDGRRSFGPKEANFLVYFAQEIDDPRKPNPERLSDQRRLTREEFQAGLAENRRLQVGNPSQGPMQHMIVVKTPAGAKTRVGPTAASPFFKEGAKPFERQVDGIIRAKFDAFVKRNVFSEQKTARIVLN